MQTETQRLTALRLANEIRSQRAREKAALRDPAAGKSRAAKLLAEVPGYWRSASVEDVLLAIRGVGKVKTQTILRRLHISGTKRLDQLSHGTRRRLIEEIVA